MPWHCYGLINEASDFYIQILLKPQYETNNKNLGIVLFPLLAKLFIQVISSCIPIVFQSRVNLKSFLKVRERVYHVQNSLARTYSYSKKTRYGHIFLAYSLLRGILPFKDDH